MKAVVQKQPSKRKQEEDVLRAINQFDDAIPQIRRMFSDRAGEIMAAARTIRSQRAFAHFVAIPFRHASKAERTNRTATECVRAMLIQAGFPEPWWPLLHI